VRSLYRSPGRIPSGSVPGTRRVLAAVLGGVLAAHAATAGAYAADPSPKSTPLRAQIESLDKVGKEVRGKAPVQPVLNTSQLKAPTWPAAGKAQMSPVAASAARAGAAVRAGSLPVWIAPAPGRAAPAVTAEVLDRAKLPETWRDAVLVRVSSNPATSKAASAATATAVTATDISIGYDTFRGAYGGDWASRLRLWQLPPCATVTPDLPACRPAPLVSRNDAASARVTASVQVSSTAAGTLVALAADAAGSAGDFAATPLSATSTWSSGGFTGDFNWNYPMRTPPAAGGPSPKLGLSYSSGSVDGRSSATNNQPSWIGEGFEYHPGFIERKYIGCAEDMKDSATNKERTGDSCWRSDNATLSLNGRSTELIWDKAEGWHGRVEDGSVIKKLTGATNGDNNGEHWQVTTTDGVRYFFGLNKLPGQSDATDSSWTTRVYGNHKGEPCFDEAFAKANCNQTWRWNLDYVIDPRGNTLSYWYDKETNNYAPNVKKADLASYVRGGFLKRIDYGTWDRSDTDRSVSAQGQVVFTVADRCKSDCTKHNGTNWPDVPWDQECKSDVTTCDNFSPTYWSTKRLAKITTKIRDTTAATPGTWQDVDSWTFSHDYPSPNDGNHAGLWLSSIVHTGLVGTDKSLPPVTFSPTTLPNRVLTDHNRTESWQRLGSIVSETGATTVITYSLPECTEASTKNQDAHTNTQLCYPVIGPNPADPDEKDITEWWHKYVVRQISESDVQLAGGHQSPIRNTYYDYKGAPAWHYADDDGFTKENRKTWSQFRGYATVDTRVGDTDSPQTLTRTTFLRGMHGDRLAPAGGTRKVAVDASLGDETVNDEDQFAGMVREQAIFNGSLTKPISKTVNVPWRSPATASRTSNGDTVEARYIGARVAYAAMALGVDGARGWSVGRTETSFNDDSTPKWVQSDPDVAAANDETCVSTTYNNNAAKNIIGLPERVTTTALTCNKKAATAADIISDERTSYDQAADHTTAPKYGSVSRTERLLNWTAATGTVFQPVSSSTFDAFGRVITATDIRGDTTTTTYEPATGPVATVKTVTAKPYEWKTSTSKAPYWGATTKTVDQNGRVAEGEFDALGQLVKSWTVGWSKADHPDAPSEQVDYIYSPTRSDYPYIKSRRLNAAGKYIESFTIYDGFMRSRQIQTSGPDGNRIVSDSNYDQYGREASAYDAHAEPGAPSGALWWEPEWSLRVVLRRIFDNAGRPTAVVTMAGDGVTNLVEKYRTTTEYEGDITKVTPPKGGVPTTTLTDAAGRIREMRQHTTAEGVRGAYDALTYAYDRKGQMVKTTDAGGNEWTQAFNIRGLQIEDKDPDKGRTTYDFNDLDELIRTTDSEGRVVAYGYDGLGRKTGLFDNVVSEATRRLQWKYDRLYTGQPMAGKLTESIRFDNKRQYKRQTVSFNERYQETGVNYVVPYEESGLGGTYTYAYGFSAFDGSPQSTTFPAAGGLPTEKVTYGFDPASGLPTTVGTNLPGVTSYITGQEYNALGEPTVTTRKTDGGEYVQNGVSYEPVTRRIAETTVKPETATGTVAQRRYHWDDSGNLLSISDTPQVGEAETQCFRYDGLRRLTSAWTPKATISCGVDPTVANLGGPAAYWTDWTIDKLGNRRTEVAHTSAGDTTRTYAVPDPGATVVQPHSTTGVTTSAPGQAAGTVAFTYDKTGNMTARSAPGGARQKLGWDVEGRLTSITEGAAVTTNLYDADGARLLHRNSDGTTLYLPGMELRRGSTVTNNVATRYYGFLNQPIGSRTATGGLQWLFADNQGTQLTSVDEATQKVTVRRQTPYGGPRGSQATWPNRKGFVGGDIDPTGLVHVGAREYDPLIGRFISVDPIMDVNDPQQMNGYAYSYNAPTTFSDPTGLRPMMPWEQYQQSQMQAKAGPQNTPVKPPPVTNNKLRHILADDVYARPGVKKVYGQGKVGDAITREFKTGQQTVGKWHYEKGARAFKQLSSLLEENRWAIYKGKPPLLNEHDLKVAKKEAAALWSVLNSHDEAGAFTNDMNSTPEKIKVLKDAKGAIDSGAKNRAVADITESVLGPRQVVEGKGEVGQQPIVEGPKLRGVAKALGALGIVGEIGSAYGGLKQAERECGDKCHPLEISSYMMCAMILGCDDPYSYLGVPNPHTPVTGCGYMCA
jgi:RHS repeat-associated protein